MIDIHSHIIPGVDDGSASLRESLSLIQSAISQGVTSIFCTPHNSAFDYNANIRCIFNDLEDSIKDIPLQTSLYYGSEIFCEADSIKSILKKIEKNKYPTMNNTNYVLVEFNPYDSSDKDAVSCVKCIIEDGLIPIIAHAERYDFSEVKTIERLASKGALIQINAYSLAMEQKEKIKLLARELMKEKLVSFIGSDTHRTHHRPCMVKEGIKYAYVHFKEEYVDEVMFKNANKLLIRRD